MNILLCDAWIIISAIGTVVLALCALIALAVSLLVYFNQRKTVRGQLDLWLGIDNEFRNDADIVYAYNKIESQQEWFSHQANAGDNCANPAQYFIVAADMIKFDKLFAKLTQLILLKNEKVFPYFADKHFAYRESIILNNPDTKRYFKYIKLVKLNSTFDH